MAIVFVVSLIGCRSGEPTATTLASAYVAAATRGDVTALQRLVPDEFDAGAAIATKVAHYRNVDPASIRQTITVDGISPRFARADFRGANGFSDQVAMERRQNRWYVLLGHTRGSNPGRTATPSRSPSPAP